MPQIDTFIQAGWSYRKIAAHSDMSLSMVQRMAKLIKKREIRCGIVVDGDDIIIHTDSNADKNVATAAIVKAFDKAGIIYG